METPKPESPRSTSGDSAATDDPVERCPGSCPDVSFFEGCKTRAKYFGFDHKTDLVDKPGTDEYWLPTPERGTITMPTDREFRDAARWVSVAVTKETEVEIDFAFAKTETLACITNCTYEVIPATIAEVVTTKITARKAAFTIKGAAEGEASLKVICDGKDIGWFHIWAKNEATIKIDIVDLVTTKVELAKFDIAAMRAAFDEIYRQAAIKVDMISIGTVDLSKDKALATLEDKGYSDQIEFLAKLSVAGTPQKADAPTPKSYKDAILAALDSKASAVLGARKAVPLPRAGAYRIYRYVQVDGCSVAGTVINIGSSPAFIFLIDDDYCRNAIAHEFGHCLGLRHPSDKDGTGQYAAHNLSTLDKDVPEFAATNTEPTTAKKTGKKDSNILANDPTNLMGYWEDKTIRKPLRYHQWKACSRS